MGSAREIRGDVSPFTTLSSVIVITSGKKHVCRSLAATWQTQPGGRSTELFPLVVTLRFSHSLSVPLEVGPRSSELQLEYHGPTGKMRKTGRHTPVGRKRNETEENAKKTWHVGEKEEQKEKGRKEVMVTEESGKGRVRGGDEKEKRMEPMERGRERGEDLGGKGGGGEQSLRDRSGCSLFRKLDGATNRAALSWN